MVNLKEPLKICLHNIFSSRQVENHPAHAISHDSFWFLFYPCKTAITALWLRKVTGLIFCKPSFSQPAFKPGPNPTFLIFSISHQNNIRKIRKEIFNWSLLIKLTDFYYFLNRMILTFLPYLTPQIWVFFTSKFVSLSL